MGRNQKQNRRNGKTRSTRPPVAPQCSRPNRSMCAVVELGLILPMLLVACGCGPTTVPYLISADTARKTDVICRQAIDALAAGDRGTLQELGLPQNEVEAGIAKADLIVRPVHAQFLLDFVIATSYARQYRAQETGETSMEIRVWIMKSAKGYRVYGLQFFGGARHESGTDAEAAGNGQG